MTKRKNPEDKLKTGRPSGYNEEIGSRICRAKNKGGRPTDYNPEIATKICELIASNTIGVKRLCTMHEWMPSHETVYQWIIRHKEFADLYATAKERQQDLQVEEMLEIADDDTNDMIQTEKGWAANMAAINRARLRIDTRKWHASKLNAKKYGDKMQQEVTIVKHEDALKELE